jgi:hypothetical protein
VIGGVESWVGSIIKSGLMGGGFQHCVVFGSCGVGGCGWWWWWWWWWLHW